MASVDQLTDTMGRYFSVISAIPSALLVVWMFLLLHTGAPRSQPDWSEAARVLASVDFKGAAALVVASVALGLVFHPLQFAVVQAYEGYWGLGRVAVAARAARSDFYARRKDIYSERFEEVANAAPEDTTSKDLVVADEAARLRGYMPRHTDDVMPTRLGNVLKYYETAVGAPYGLNGPRVLPHLALVAPPAHITYLNDQRTLLDLAVRLSFMSVLGTVATVAILWPTGLWVLVALAPYSLAYLFYRGAIVVAASYGIAMGAIVDLNRFALYESMHLPLPAGTRDERHRNENLNRLLDFDAEVELRYATSRKRPKN